MTTTEVLNDSTSVQSRIDTVLTAEANQLDWADDCGWFPGDPLYSRPRGYICGEQTVRSMVQLLHPDLEHFILDQFRWEPRCWTCDVSWSGADACWMCGDPTTAWPEQLLSESESVARLWEQVSQQLARVFDSRALESLRDVSEQLEQVPQRYVLGFDPAGPDGTVTVGTMMRGGQMRILPAIADVTAPTVDELAAASSVDELLLWPQVEPEPAIRVPNDIELSPSPAPPDVTLSLASARPDLFRSPAAERYDPTRWNR
jgi:hypothetical protein